MFCLSSRPYVLYICARLEKGRTYRLDDVIQNTIKNISYTHTHNHTNIIMKNTWTKSNSKHQLDRVQSRPHRPNFSARLRCVVTWPSQNFLSLSRYPHKVSTQAHTKLNKETSRQRLQQEQILDVGPVEKRRAFSKASRKRMETTENNGAIH